MQTSIEKLQKQRTLGCLQGLTRKPDLFPPSHSPGELCFRQCLDGRRSRSLFPSHLVLRGHESFGRSCLVSNQSWISTCSSAQRPGYRNPPVLLLSSCKILTFSTRAEPIRFPSAQPFIFIFKCSFPVFQPELSPSERPCCSLGCSSPHPGPISLLGAFMMFSKLKSFCHALCYPKNDLTFPSTRSN